MIVRIFKTSQPIAMLSIPLIGLILRLGVFFGAYDPQLLPNNYMPFFDGIYTFHLGYPILSGLLSWILVSVQALYFNFIIEEQSILPRKNYLFGFLYITVMSYFPEFHYLSPAVVSTLLLLPAFHKVLILSRQNTSLSHAFDSALLTSIASLVYFPSVLFFPIVLLALIYFKPIKVRYWLLCFVGLCLPYLFLFTYLYWQEGTEGFWIRLIQVNFGEGHTNGWSQLKLLIPLIPIIGIAIPKYFNGSRGNTVRVKHIYYLSIWLIVLSILNFIVFSSNDFGYVVPAMLGSCLFIAHYFYFENRNWLSDVTYLFLFISVIYINYLL